ncbi:MULTISPECIES: TipAS antibiotic-recognition domain-containing protein [unclassified Micromonospora]|uniref:TipAS antibiotic-recognition domain-containing protein n=1 Tax=unclassified Micromonospora TaxID=2617518 RepID=UPI002FF16270
MLHVLPGLQFTEFHKFLVSAGGLSLGLSAALPVFLMKSQKATTMRADDVAKMDPASREALTIQQGHLLMTLKIWPYISGSLLILGLALVVYGGVKWRQRQRVLDNREDEEIQRIKAEKEKLVQEAASFMRAHQLPVDEQVQALEKELEQELEEDGTTDPEIPGPSGKTSDAEETARDVKERMPSQREPEGSSWVSSIRIPEDAPKTVQGVLRHYITQERAIERVKLMFNGKVEVAREVQIGPRRVDAVLTSLDPSLPNLVVDIDIVSGPINKIREKIAHAMRSASEVSYEAERRLNNHFHPLVMLVVPSDIGAKTRDLIRIIVKDDLAFTLREIGLPLTVLVVDADKLESLVVDPSWARASEPMLHWVN